jgi:pimeloyl-ACP methyl ester carboxylesterase
LALRAPARQYPALMLDQVRRRKLSLPESGIEIALLDWGGSGPLALLHHATGYCAAVWGPVAEQLSHHYRVIAMDARGHGDSSKPKGADSYRWTHFGRDVVAVAEQLAGEHRDGRIALGLGHSFGGTSILMASAERPELFGRSVLVDPVVPPPNFGPSQDASALAEGARKRRHLWPNRGAARAKWSKKETFVAWDPRALDLYLAEGFSDRADGQVELKCSGANEAAIFESAHSVDVWSIAKKARVPTLILWAARGQFPRIVYENLVRQMVDAQIREVDTGHLIPMEHPDCVVEATLDFALENSLA